MFLASCMQLIFASRRMPDKYLLSFPTYTVQYSVHVFNVFYACENANITKNRYAMRTCDVTTKYQFAALSILMTTSTQKYL